MKRWIFLFCLKSQTQNLTRCFVANAFPSGLLHIPDSECEVVTGGLTLRSLHWDCSQSLIKP